MGRQARARQVEVRAAAFKAREGQVDAGGQVAVGLVFGFGQTQEVIVVGDRDLLECLHLAHELSHAAAYDPDTMVKNAFARR